MLKLFIAYLVFMSFSETVLYKVDKERSKRGVWRVKESALLIIALLGGAAGALLAMNLFHHKTRHWYFLYGMPAILIIQILLVLALVFSPIEFLVM